MVPVDRQYAEPHLARLYDALCGRDDSGDFAFYLPLIMQAESVLDIGCGTGALLHLAAGSGHQGRLVGLDPAPAMLGVARSKPSAIDWVDGALASVRWHGEFDLAVMTGHAFQVLLTDEELRTAIASVARALRPGGAFAFETRNPGAREWERWVPADGTDFIALDGTPVRFEADVEQPVDGELVSFTTTYSSDAYSSDAYSSDAYSSDAWSTSEVSRSTLRFLDVDALDALLVDAGFTVVERYGDWDRSPLTATSPEIITIARCP